jgi:hypothetical protein
MYLHQWCKYVWWMTHICMYTFTYVYIYIHTYIYVYVYTYIHTNMWMMYDISICTPEYTCTKTGNVNLILIS